MKMLWFDTETSGLDTNESEINQIAGIVIVDGKVMEEFDFRCRFLDPDACSEEALKIQGRTLDEIMNYPPPQDLLNKYLIPLFDKYIDRYDKKDQFTTAGHNIAAYDIPMLASFCKRLGFKYLFSYIAGPKMDTLHMAWLAKILGKINPENLQLPTLAKYFNIDGSEDAHDALVDVRMNRIVGNQLIKLITG